MSRAAAARGDRFRVTAAHCRWAAASHSHTQTNKKPAAGRAPLHAADHAPVGTALDGMPLQKSETPLAAANITTRSASPPSVDELRSSPREPAARSPRGVVGDPRSEVFPDADKVAAASSMCALTLMFSQHKHGRCTPSESFGCLDERHMRVDDGCRGIFNCSGGIMRCGYSRTAGAEKCRCNHSALPREVAGSTSDESMPPPPHIPTSTNVSRCALVLTGHLRDTCDAQHSGLQVVAQHASACRAAFGGQCDVFMHTWSTLDSAGEGSRTSALACVSRLEPLVPLAAVTVEQQIAPTNRTRWGLGETLNAFRMNSVAMAGGVALMSRHALTMARPYNAVVRMRADVGSTKMQSRSSFRGRFISANGWAQVRLRADRHLRGKLSPARASEIVACNRPSGKQGDFCFWSAPATPLARTVEALSNGFDDLAFGENSTACRAFLNRSKLPAFSENLLRCAMWATNVSASPLKEGEPPSSCRANC